MQRGKDDKVDAHRIAMYAFRHHDQAVIFERPRREVEKLKHLLTICQRLIKQKKQLKVPLKELEGILEKSMYKRIENYSKNTLKGLKKDLEALERIYIDMIIKQDKALSKSVCLATSVRGVGKTTAISLLVATNEFKTVSSARQLAWLCRDSAFHPSIGFEYKKKKQRVYFCQ